MSYMFTRSALRTRLLIERHVKSGSGNAEVPRLNQILQYSINHVWETLTSTDQGFNVFRLTKVVDALDVDGWIPDATSIPLPTDFRRIVGRPFRDNRPIDMVTASQTLEMSPNSYWYMVSGPSQSVDAITGVLSPVPQTLDVNPALVNAETWKLVYVKQPPSLGDPTLGNGLTDDGVTVDLVGDGIARMVLARAGVLMVATDDKEGYQRAQNEYGLALSEYTNARAQREGGVRFLGRGKRPGYRSY